ncbi:hypothetical protein DSECCO2_246120 [anaerobic digester metagenome]
MQPLNFPDYKFRIRESSERREIFDPLRRRFVALTPEEWVRQHLIQYLCNDRKVPGHMVASERGLRVNRMPRRFDLLVFAPDGRPVMIAECKAPRVPLTEEVFFQASAYNLALKVDYLLITNGIEHYCAKVNYQDKKLDFCSDIPEYAVLCGTNIL